MIYIFRNLNKILELPNLHQVYLVLESVIYYAMIYGWGVAFDNAVICKNQIIKILLNKEQLMYSTIYLCKKLNVIPVNKIYPKIITINIAWSKHKIHINHFTINRSKNSHLVNILK